MDEDQLELFPPVSDPLDAVLIKARDILFEGNWELLEQEMRARLTRKPVNSKLFERVEADLARISRMKREGI